MLPHLSICAMYGSLLSLLSIVSLSLPQQRAHFLPAAPSLPLSVSLSLSLSILCLSVSLSVSFLAAGDGSLSNDAPLLQHRKGSAGSWGVVGFKETLKSLQSIQEKAQDALRNSGSGGSGQSLSPAAAAAAAVAALDTRGGDNEKRWEGEPIRM